MCFVEPAGMGRFQVGEPGYSVAAADPAYRWRIDRTAPRSTGLAAWAPRPDRIGLFSTGHGWMSRGSLSALHFWHRIISLTEDSMTDAELVVKLRAWDKLPARMRELPDDKLVQIARSACRQRRAQIEMLHNRAATADFFRSLGMLDEVAGEAPKKST